MILVMLLAIVTCDIFTIKNYQYLLNLIKRLGFDGLVYQNYVETGKDNPWETPAEERESSWVAFDSTQIKSVFNNGNFSGISSNIME